ncbi:anthrone oxygenase family protein [Streptosporangium sp. NPDC003464]
MTRAVQFAALAATGLLMGILAGGVLTAQAMAGQPANVYAAVARPTHLTFAFPMMAIMLVAVVATAALLITQRQPIIAIAFLLLLVAVATTLVVNVPLNGQMISEWPAHGIPPDWTQIRDRWNAWHLFRTAVSIVAFGSLVTATLLRPSGNVVDGVPLADQVKDEPG